MKHFETYHPIILFLFFVGAIVISMFTLNPILIALCYLSGILFCGLLIGIRKLLKSLAYSIPALILIAIVNPLFVHRGETILFFLNDNPVTLEAIFYGTATGFMLMSVFYWFKCYSAVMTSDKFIYLFGCIIPKLSLILSMALRFIPKLKRQFHEVDEVQKAMGLYTGKSISDRIKSKFRVFSALISWSLENSIDTADSMRSRGYGLKRRTSYSLFRWQKRDTILLIVLIALMGFVFVSMFMGYMDFLYYPILTLFGFTWPSTVCCIFVFVLLFLATLMEIKENIKWRYLRSRI